MAMKYIGMKSEGYTYRYYFEPMLSTSESFNLNFITPVKPRSSASESLDICLNLLTRIFGKEEVRKTISILDY